MVTITLDEKQAVAVEKMCEMELNYKIHESCCCCQYEPEIKALLLILKPLNVASYKDFKESFKERKKEEKTHRR